MDGKSLIAFISLRSVWLNIEHHLSSIVDTNGQKNCPPGPPPPPSKKNVNFKFAEYDQNVVKTGIKWA